LYRLRRIPITALRTAHAQLPPRRGLVWRRPIRLLAALAGVTALVAGGAGAPGGAGLATAGTYRPQVEIAKTFSSQSARLVDIDCPGTAVCYAVGTQAGLAAGGVVVRSSDGGRSWTLRRVGAVTDLQRIACPAPNICHALGTVGTAGGRLVSVILSTFDGGATWHTFSPGGNFPSRDAILLDLTCPALATCYAVGSVFGMGGAFPTGLVLTTDDGGTTWLTRTVRQYALAGIACPSVTTCFAVGGKGGVSGVRSVFLTTDDGARTWHPQSVGALDGLYRLACPSARLCIDVGYSRAPGRAGRGVIMVSATGGATWRRSYDTGSEDRALEDVACSSARICVAVGEGGKAVTSLDGGTTWSAGTVDARREQTAVSCPSEGMCYMADWNESRSRSSILQSNIILINDVAD
jgi:photosystem II stability/assembly factor-like uncharacterized protein